jgi:glycyl-tRNA synthetase
VLKKKPAEMKGRSPSLPLQAGNEAVLRARFEDAQFFYNNDLNTPLAEAR